MEYVNIVNIDTLASAIRERNAIEREKLKFEKEKFEFNKQVNLAPIYSGSVVTKEQNDALYELGKTFLELIPAEFYNRLSEVEVKILPCKECENYGWDVPQCSECNLSNNFRYFSKRGNSI